MTLRGLALLGLICLATGCYSHRLGQLDRRVAELIRREQADWLDPSIEHDPAPAPPLPARIDGRSEAVSPIPPTGDGMRADVEPTTTGAVRRAGYADADADTTSADAAGPGAAATAVGMDLRQVLAYAVAHAPEYRTEKESLFLEAIAFLSEQHLWGPRFFSTFSADYATVPEGGDHDQALTLTQDLRVTQRLPYGGEVSARALVNYVNQLRSADGAATDTQAAEASVSLTLPLLRGAGEAARESLVQAERSLIYAVRRFERYRRSFLVDIAGDFYSLLQQGVNIENQRRQLRSLEDEERRRNALAEAGRVAFFEVQRFQSEVLFARSNLEDQTEQYAASLDSLKIRIGMPVDADLTLVTSMVEVPEALLDPGEAVPIAQRDRLDLRNTADQVEDSRRSVRISRNRMLPDLDLRADMRVPTQSGRQFGGFDLDPGQGSVGAGLTLDLPLDRRQEWLAYRGALVRLEQSQRNYQLERDRVAIEVRSAIRQVRRDRYNVELQQRNVTLAERRMVEVQLKARTLGPEEVISANQDLLDAQNRLVEATRNYRQNQLQFLLATGQMRVTAAGQWLAPAHFQQPPAVQEDGRVPAEDVVADGPAQEPITVEQAPADAVDGGEKSQEISDSAGNPDAPGPQAE